MLNWCAAEKGETNWRKEKVVGYYSRVAEERIGAWENKLAGGNKGKTCKYRTDEPPILEKLLRQKEVRWKSILTIFDTGGRGKYIIMLKTVSSWLTQMNLQVYFF